MKNQTIHDGSKYRPNSYFIIYTHAGQLRAKWGSKYAGEHRDVRFVYDGDDAEEYIRDNSGLIGYQTMFFDLLSATDPSRPNSGWRRTRKGTPTLSLAEKEVAK